MHNAPNGVTRGIWVSRPTPSGANSRGTPTRRAALRFMAGIGVAALAGCGRRSVPVPPSRVQETQEGTASRNETADPQANAADTTSIPQRSGFFLDFLID